MLKLTKFNNNYTWRNTLRFVTINKLSLSNTFSVLTFNNVNIFLVLNNLENFDNSRLVAASFILKLISNQQPFVTKFSLFQTFRKKDYEITICVSLRDEKMYLFLSMLASAAIPVLSKADARVSFSSFNSCIVANFAIFDFSFIKIIETHSAFFRWRDKVNVSLYSNAKSFNEIKFLLGITKLIR